MTFAEQAAAGTRPRGYSDGEIPGRPFILRWFRRQEGPQNLAEVSSTPVDDIQAWGRGFAQMARALAEPSPR